jgi:hypothetical protein
VLLLFDIVEGGDGKVKVFVGIVGDCIAGIDGLFLET